jgi:phosphatidylglycerophosphatase A
MLRRTILWPSLLPKSWIINLSTLFHLGYLRPAPGTWGSVAGLLFYILIFHSLPPFLYLFCLLFWTWFAIGICGEAEVRMRKRDPSEVILDELVAIPYCFIGLQAVLTDGTTWFWSLAGLLLFRFFDILKPLGIRRLQRLHGGLGVVIDDIAAAIATCIILHVLVRYLGQVPF